MRGCYVKKDENITDPKNKIDILEFVLVNGDQSILTKVNSNTIMFSKS